MGMSKAVKNVLNGHLNFEDPKKNQSLDLKFTLFIRFMKVEAEALDEPKKGIIAVNQAIKDEKDYLMKEISSKLKEIHDMFNSKENISTHKSLYF